MKQSFLLLSLALLFPGLAGAQQKVPVKKPAAAPTAVGLTPAGSGPKRPRNLSDEQLLDLVQRQTFRYFWDFGHPVSGMARERSNVSFDYGDEVVTTGGTGFGLMAIIVAAERGWITREQAAERTLKIVNFLWKADMYHGVFPHWLNGATGKTIRFSPKDDGGDLVETSFLFEGLICARQYYTRDTPAESALRNKILWMWEGVEWNWHQQGGQNVLYWHWSPNNGWSMNHQIHGWNECLVTYVLAASSPKYAIDKAVYDQGWATGNYFKNGKEFYKTKLPLGFDYGGPLFFSHYSFLGIDPRGLKDQYADYMQQNQAHTLINRAYCIDNPKHYKGYGADTWGLTASDSYKGYAAHSPTEDLGVISPTAALSAMPYAPEFSMQALRHFYNDLGDNIWGEYGFVDAFSEEHNWQAKSYLAIDQGPIVGMIENHRTGLLWKLFMSSPDVQRGLTKLGFESPQLKK
ncbi:beta-glucosidase [Hymenobacter amundsenii]|uniref:Beta-glucosidase n=1 Tax=Hymenobacter amundsenii TaxID=2006685 RepID=A0A246FHQ7_9BACT|nr:glucoamylase family protein [Hymenobacter amundsenii]OWP62054.1 beta-glucosidase [Hymenobacter amundsenii]